MTNQKKSGPCVHCLRLLLTVPMRARTFISRLALLYRCYLLYLYPRLFYLFFFLPGQWRVLAHINYKMYIYIYYVLQVYDPAKYDDWEWTSYYPGNCVIASKILVYEVGQIR